MKIYLVFLFKKSKKLVFGALIFSFALLISQKCSVNKSDSKDLNNNKLIHDSLSWAEKMAVSEMERRGTSLEYSENKKNVKWNYQTGLFLKSLLDLYKHTGHGIYFDFSRKVIDSYLDTDGSIKTYKMEDYNIDKINSGKVLLFLYKETGNTVYLKSADILRQQLKEQPRTKAGGFWHKKRYPWQMWLDGIYMGVPFYAEYSLITNNFKDLNDALKQILIIDVQTRDPDTKLRYHGWDESNEQEWANPENGNSPNFWGRAMGWYAMAIVDVLDFIPQNHPNRNEVIFILNDLCKALVKYQDSESGVWYQIVDQGDRRGNYLEASASCMYVYALAKGVHKHYIVY